MGFCTRSDGRPINNFKGTRNRNSAAMAHVWTAEHEAAEDRFMTAKEEGIVFLSGPENKCPVKPSCTNWGFYKTVYFTRDAFGESVIKHSLGRKFSGCCNGRWNLRELIKLIDRFIEKEMMDLNKPKRKRGRTTESAKPPENLYKFDCELGFTQPTK